MKKKVLIIDTCLACVWLRVPGMEVAGSDNDRWDYERVKEKLDFETQKGTLLVLPIASIIETGNHITQIKVRNRISYIQNLGDIIKRSIDGTTPWIAYSNQNKLWEGTHLKDVVDRWISLNKDHAKHSLGDVSILDVTTAYMEAGFDVEILTADELLKSYEQINLNNDVPEPRRRSK